MLVIVGWWWVWYVLIKGEIAAIYRPKTHALRGDWKEVTCNDLHKNILRSTCSDALLNERYGNFKFYGWAFRVFLQQLAVLVFHTECSKWKMWKSGILGMANLRFCGNWDICCELTVGVTFFSFFCFVFGKSRWTFIWTNTFKSKEYNTTIIIIIRIFNLLALPVLNHKAIM